MKKKNAIIFTIGEKGTILSIHDSKSISNKVFFEEFDDQVKESINKILSKNKTQNIYITFDTLDQSFKKKDFPSMKKGDLKLLIKREIDIDPDKESLKSYIILNSDNKSKNKPWEVIFVSFSIHKNTQNLLEYIYNLPNRVVGIYLLPIESISLIDSINSTADNKDKKDKIDCLVTKTKVSGMRQTIYNNNQILFTRLLDYDSSDPNFLRKYEKDIYASFEYLKRIFPEASIAKFHITNILSKKAISLISKMKNIELNMESHTPYQIAKIIDKDFSISENTKSSDLVSSRSFFKKTKEILKFSTPQILKAQKTYLLMKSSYFFNIAILFGIGILSIGSISKISKSEEMINVVKIKKLNTQNELNYTKKKLEEKEAELRKKYPQADISGNKIIEIGQINESLHEIENLPFKEYVKLSFLTKHNVKIKNVSYKIDNFKPENPQNKKFEIAIDAELMNPSGDVDELFVKYDEFKYELEKKYKKDYKVSINDIPKNINLAKKYHSFTLKINISGK